MIKAVKMSQPFCTITWCKTKEGKNSRKSWNGTMHIEGFMVGSFNPKKSVVGKALEGIKLSENNNFTISKYNKVFEPGPHGTQLRIEMEIDYRHDADNLTIETANVLYEAVLGALVERISLAAKYIDAGVYPVTLINNKKASATVVIVMSNFNGEMAK